MVYTFSHSLTLFQHPLTHSFFITPSSRYERVTRTALKVLKNVGHGTSSTTEISGKVTAQLQMLVDMAEESRARLHREFKTELLVIKDASSAGHYPLLDSSQGTRTSCHIISIPLYQYTLRTVFTHRNSLSLSLIHAVTYRRTRWGRRDIDTISSFQRNSWWYRWYTNHGC